MKIKKLFFLFAPLFIGLASLHGQTRWDVGVSSGTGNYLGEIGGKELPGRDLFFDLHLDQSKFSSHLFARYRFNNITSVRVSFGTVFIKDTDAASTNPGRVARNAHFRNTIYEGTVRVQGVFWARPNLLPYKFRRRVSGEVYGIAGFTLFKHNPQARLTRTAAESHYESGLITTNPDSYDYDLWYNLRKYQTGGVAYSQLSIAIPMGIGAGVTLNNDWRFAFEMVWSVTFTDFLDDLSTTYTDTENLNDIGIILSRPSGLPYSSGSQRGNPGRNDAYGTLQVSVSKTIKYRSAYSKP
ncbi:hypothetical protein N9C00_01990 [Flavobacteriales bacterium]|nr:hypothetical protein [Flavobacteriales bacterium]